MSMFELQEAPTKAAKIIVFGVGGGGCNAATYMLNEGVEGVDFICANTDAQALKKCENAHAVIQLGEEETKGLGAGADPDVGRKAAEEKAAILLRLAEKLEVTCNGNTIPVSLAYGIVDLEAHQNAEAALAAADRAMYERKKARDT